MWSRSGVELGYSEVKDKAAFTQDRWWWGGVVSPRVRSRVANGGERPAAAVRPKATVGAGRGAWAGKGEGSEAGSLKATRGLSSRRGLVSPCPYASRPRRPSAARLAPDPQLTEGRSEGAGALPAAAARKPRMGRRGLPATDNRKRLPRRLTPSRQLCVRSRPCPWSQSWGPEGPRGGASALRCRRIPSPGVGRYVV